MGSLIDKICFASISEVDNLSVFIVINCSLSCMYIYTGVTQFELLDCIIKVNKLSTRVVVVYRSPPSCKNGL